MASSGGAPARAFAPRPARRSPASARRARELGVEERHEVGAAVQRGQPARREVRARRVDAAGEGLVALRPAPGAPERERDARVARQAARRRPYPRGDAPVRRARAAPCGQSASDPGPPRGSSSARDDAREVEEEVAVRKVDDLVADPEVDGHGGGRPATRRTRRPRDRTAPSARARPSARTTPRRRASRGPPRGAATRGRPRSRPRERPRVPRARPARAALPTRRLRARRLPQRRPSGSCARAVAQEPDATRARRAPRPRSGSRRAGGTGTRGRSAIALGRESPAPPAPRAAAAGSRRRTTSPRASRRKHVERLDAAPSRTRTATSSFRSNDANAYIPPAQGPHHPSAAKRPAGERSAALEGGEEQRGVPSLGPGAPRPRPRAAGRRGGRAAARGRISPL